MLRHSFTILTLFDFAHDVHRFNVSLICSRTCAALLHYLQQCSLLSTLVFLFVPACKCMHTRAEKDKFEANKKNALKRLHTEHMACTALSQRQAAGRSRTRGAT